MQRQMSVAIFLGEVVRYTNGPIGTGPSESTRATTTSGASATAGSIAWRRSDRGPPNRASARRSTDSATYTLRTHPSRVSTSHASGKAPSSTVIRIPAGRGGSSRASAGYHQT